MYLCNPFKDAQKCRTTYITLGSNTKLSVKSFLFIVLDPAKAMNSRLLIIVLIGGALVSYHITAGKIILHVNLINDIELIK